GGTNGQPPDTLAGGRKDGVADGGGGRRNSGFAAASGRLGAGHDVHVDGGRGIAQAEDFVVVEVTLVDAAVRDGDFTLESLRQAEVHGALHLGFDPERVDGQAAIDGADDAVHSNGSSGGVAGDLDNLGDEAAPAETNADAARGASRKRLAPAGLFRGQLDDAAAAHDVQGSAILTQVDFSSGAQRRE